MNDKRATADALIARIAARQHGVVATGQLADAGLSRSAIASRSRLGRLHEIHRGVYAVGHPGLSAHGRWMAAVLAASQVDRAACLSHRSAAELWGMLTSRRGDVDLTIFGDGGRKWRRGIRLHRSRTLRPSMVEKRLGIPLTSPRRTISDLRRAKPGRGGAPPREVRRAMRQAAVLGLPLGPGIAPERTRSDLELLFQRICRRQRVPQPEVNMKVAPLLEVDFLWRDRRLVVETDGWRYHRGRVAFESDRERDLRLTELGFRVLRFSEVQLENEPARVAALVRRELAAD